MSGGPGHSRMTVAEFSPTLRYHDPMLSTPRRLAAVGLVTLSAVVSSTVFVAPAGAAVQQDTTTTTPAPAPAPAPAGPIVLHYLPLTGPELAEGTQNGEVWLMQITLSLRGYFLRDDPGAFRASTRHALTAFQKSVGLPRTGKLDAMSRFILGATLDKVPTRAGRVNARAAEVDLARQILIVTDNGVANYVFDISSGKSSTRTPKGNFKIQRQINGLRISRLGRLWRPKYFTGGYALHGSPSVPNYPASHGCVRLTNQEIDFIWDANLIPVGTPLTVY